MSVHEYARRELAWRDGPQGRKVLSNAEKLARVGQWHVYRVCCKISTDKCVDREIASTSADEAANYCKFLGSDVRVVTDLGPITEVVARLNAATNAR
jgi:hypothetical protein